MPAVKSGVISIEQLVNQEWVAYRRNGDGGGLRRWGASGHGGSKDSEGHDDREATRDAREHCVYREGLLNDLWGVVRLLNSCWLGQPLYLESWPVRYVISPSAEGNMASPRGSASMAMLSHSGYVSC